jgi:hypothetical protein
LSATGVSALLLGVWCGPALASTEITAPCPDLVSHTETSLHEVLDEDIAAPPAIRTVESSTEQDEDDASDDAVILNTEMPDIATTLPGVSASGLPRFRRHMFRTDI